MIITCYTQEVEVRPYLEGSSKEFAVMVGSLQEALSLTENPEPITFEYLDLGGLVGVPLRFLNHYLFSVSPMKSNEEVLFEFREGLAIEIHKSLTGEVGFLSFASERLRSSLNRLQGYFDKTGLDIEYPLSEIKETLFEIFCDFLQVGSYDPLLLQKDREPLAIHEAWLLCLLEETTSELIYEFIDSKFVPEDILMFLQISLKERLTDILTKMSIHVEEFLSPDETSVINGSIPLIS